MGLHLNELTFALAVILGMISHYAKKNLKGETHVKITEWFGSANLYGTLSSLGSALMLIVAALANGVILPDMQFWSVVYVGLTTGFAADAATNSDGTKKKQLATDAPAEVAATTEAPKE